MEVDRTYGSTLTQRSTRRPVQARLSSI